jgi:hypothetical protein
VLFGKNGINPPWNIVHVTSIVPQNRYLHLVILIQFHDLEFQYFVYIVE